MSMLSCSLAGLLLAAIALPVRAQLPNTHLNVSSQEMVRLEYLTAVDVATGLYRSYWVEYINGRTSPRVYGPEFVTREDRTLIVTDYDAMLRCTVNFSPDVIKPGGSRIELRAKVSNGYLSLVSLIPTSFQIGWEGMEKHYTAGVALPGGTRLTLPEVDPVKPPPIFAMRLVLYGYYTQ